MKTERLTDTQGKEDQEMFYCPGCKTYHSFIVRSEIPGRPVWQWNGDRDKPTFSPSLRVQWTGRISGQSHSQDHLCHSFVRDGQIQFLGDCTHALVGQTVPLPDVEDE